MNHYSHEDIKVRVFKFLIFAFLFVGFFPSCGGGNSSLIYRSEEYLKNSSANINLAPPTLLSPKGCSSSSNPFFYWSASDGAQSYVITVVNGSDTVYEEVTRSTSIQLDGFLSDKQYQWHVRAANETTVSDQSSISFFYWSGYPCPPQ